MIIRNSKIVTIPVKVLDITFGLRMHNQKIVDKICASNLASPPTSAKKGPTLAANSESNSLPSKTENDLFSAACKTVTTFLNSSPD